MGGVSDRGPKARGRPPFAEAIATLRGLYGKPKPPAVTDPFQQILWENVAYLTSDAKRAEAFAMLEQNVGLESRRILAAPLSTLQQIGRKGILPVGTAAKLYQIAEIALEEFGGNLRPILKLPLKDAKKALRKFPSIGEPAAEKILLFARAHPVFGLDSNGLRPLLRLGFGKEGKSYSASYRSAQEAVAPELPRDFDGLIEAAQLLRRHGQELCKRSHPRCEACPLRPDCAYAQLAAKAAPTRSRPTGSRGRREIVRSRRPAPDSK
jgi:endonuclease III